MNISYYFLFFFSAFLLSVSLFLQFGAHLAPCSLCILARLMTLGATLYWLIFSCRPPRTAQQRKGVHLVGLSWPLLGILIAGRHAWLLHFPSPLPAVCGPDFNYLLKTLPFHRAVVAFLKSPSGCMESPTYFLGVSLPLWTVIGFLGLLGLTLWSYCRTARYAKK